MIAIIVLGLLASGAYFWNERQRERADEAAARSYQRAIDSANAVLDHPSN